MNIFTNIKDYLRKQRIINLKRNIAANQARLDYWNSKVNVGSDGKHVYQCEKESKWAARIAADQVELDVLLGVDMDI